MLILRYLWYSFATKIMASFSWIKCFTDIEWKMTFSIVVYDCDKTRKKGHLVDQTQLDFAQWCIMKIAYK